MSDFIGPCLEHCYNNYTTYLMILLFIIIMIFVIFFFYGDRFYKMINNYNKNGNLMLDELDINI